MVGRVAFQMDQDVVEHSRTVYTVLGLLADIGGLLLVLTWIGLAFVKICSKNGINKHLMNQIFKSEAF